MVGEESSLRNQLLLHNWHILQRMKMQILVISQEEDDVWLVRSGGILQYILYIVIDSWKEEWTSWSDAKVVKEHVGCHFQYKVKIAANLYMNKTPWCSGE